MILSCFSPTMCSKHVIRKIITAKHTFYGATQCFSSSNLQGYGFHFSTSSLSMDLHSFPVKVQKHAVSCIGISISHECKCVSCNSLQSYLLWSPPTTLVSPASLVRFLVHSVLKLRLWKMDKTHYTAKCYYCNVVSKCIVIIFLLCIKFPLYFYDVHKISTWLHLPWCGSITISSL